MTNMGIFPIIGLRSLRRLPKFTDDHLRREIDDILNRKPDATRKEIVAALYWRASLKWGRVPETVKIWYREYNSPAEILAKYSPDQPRVPAGNSDGGQWTRDPNASEGGREAREAAKPKVRAANASEGGRAAREREARNRRILEEVSKPNSKFNVLTNSDGTYLRGPTDQYVMYPNDHPPSYFVSKGQQTRSLLDNPLTHSAGLEFFATNAAKSNHGFAWDFQRQRHSSGKIVFVPELRDYSTIAIGLYFSSSGVAIKDSLSIQNFFAGMYSDFAELMSKDYPSLPVRNVENTKIGYRLAHELTSKKW